MERRDVWSTALQRNALQSSPALLISEHGINDQVKSGGGAEAKE